LSHGLALGTAAVVAFLAARLMSEVRRGDRSAASAAALAGMIALALPLVNLAILLPRLSYLPHTTLGLGYVRLDALAAKLGALAPDKVLTLGLAPTFPLKLIRSPGFYLGSLTLGLSFAGFWNRDKRYLAVAFGLYALLCYVFSLDGVVRELGPSLGSSAVGSFYTHFPTRIVLGMFLALP